MSELLVEAPEGRVIPVHPLRKGELEGFIARRGAGLKALAAAQEFTAGAGQLLQSRRRDGALERVLLGLGEGRDPDPMAFRALAAGLPDGDYRIAGPAPKGAPLLRAVAWGLGGYVFDRYRPKPNRRRPRLVVEEPEVLREARRIVHACALARDMTNTPANDMGPLQVETIAREVAEAYGAAITVITGDELLEANYPLVHAVGRAAAPHRAPRMIEIAWGEQGRPLVALCGKGVVFDSGGLDIKTAAGMRQMKKDMGGAAHALALGRMIMDAGMPVRLVVLLAVVENAISGDAMRPGDIIPSRKGLTVEIGNTDAEGRLILADALARAGELQPEVTIDLATLTGAARVALGPQLPPLFTDDEALAHGVEQAGREVHDPMWRLPLWKPYAEAVEADIADLRNDPDAWANAGAVTAALFLQRFAPATGAWAHFDIFGWSGKARAGWPAGAEAQVIRALYAWLKTRFV